MGDLKHHLWGDKIHSALGCLLVAMTTSLLGLCDYVRGSGDKFVAAFGSQSWGWRTPYPGAVRSLCFYGYGGRIWHCRFEAVGLCGLKAYFQAEFWGVRTQKNRTGTSHCLGLVLGLVLVPVRSGLGLQATNILGRLFARRCLPSLDCWLTNTVLPIAGGFQNGPVSFLFPYTNITCFFFQPIRIPTAF